MTTSKVTESDIKLFSQTYTQVDSRSPRKCSIQVEVGIEGVFIECRYENGLEESLSIPTADLAVSVAKYILEKNKPCPYKEEGTIICDEDIGEVKFLYPEGVESIAHELWRLENHIHNICGHLGIVPRPKAP